jgi:hypothetical protein
MNMVMCIRNSNSKSEYKITEYSKIMNKLQNNA